MHQLLRREIGRSGLDHDWKSELHSKVPSEGDIMRQGVIQSSVKVFDLLRIGVFDCPVQDSWRQLDEMQAWSLVSFLGEDGIEKC